MTTPVVESLDNRPSFAKYYLGIAKAASERGDCRRSQVGAVLVTTDHTAIFGYNGTKEPGIPGCLDGACPRGLLTYQQLPSDRTDYSNCIAVHAEMNALNRALKVMPDKVLNSTIYITREPCDLCMRTLSAAGVTGVFYMQDGYDVE